MKISHLYSTLFAIMLLFGSCEQPAPPKVEAPVAVKPDMAQIKSDIQAIENSWADALKKKDVAAVMSIFADDAISMPNNEPLLMGKAAIQKSQEAGFAKTKGEQTFVFETTEVFSEGNQVLEIGKSTMTDAAGKVTTGKYMALFEKRDGKYVCIREIYNDDQKAK
jgi:ketosteroid isomerase-like protein